MYLSELWSWSYGSWIYNYLCLSPLMLWVRIPLRWGVLDTTLCDKVCQWLAIGRWFSSGTPVSSTNKIDRHDIAEILLKVALNTTTPKPLSHQYLLKYKILRKCIIHKKLIQHNEQAYQQTGNGNYSDSVVLPADG